MRANIYINNPFTLGRPTEEELKLLRSGVDCERSRINKLSRIVSDYFENNFIDVPDSIPQIGMGFDFEYYCQHFTDDIKELFNEAWIHKIKWVVISSPTSITIHFE